MEPDAFSVILRADGSLVASHFPDMLELTEELLDKGDTTVMRRAGNKLFFAFANGEAVYVETQHDPARKVVRYMRLQTKRRDAPPVKD